MTVKKGWRGRFFQDFEVGDVYEHPLGRTITTADNIWFTLLTQNTAPVHFDHHYASQTVFGKPLVNSCLTLALVTGQSVTDISQNVMANLGWDEVRLPNPVFEGDTVYSRRQTFHTRAQARLEVFDFIEGYYNTGRRHSSLSLPGLGMQSPAKFELQWLKAREAERVTK